MARTAPNRAIFVVGAVIAHAVAFALFSRQDGGSGYTDLSEQVDTTLPLTLVACGLIAAFTMGKGLGRRSQVKNAPATSPAGPPVLG